MSGNQQSVAVSGLRLAILAVLGTGAALGAPAASAQSAEDEADLQQLSQELAALKASYAQEVRRLRELDMQVQALQARLAGKVPPAGAQAAAPVAATAAPIAPGQAPAQASAPQSSGEGYASTAAEAEKAKAESMPRSVADVKQQAQAVATGTPRPVDRANLVRPQLADRLHGIALTDEHCRSSAAPGNGRRHRGA